MNRPYKFVAAESLPRFDGSLAPDALDIPGVTARAWRVVMVLAAGQVVESDCIDAAYTPSAADRARLARCRHRICGWVRHRLHLPRRRGRPVVLFLYGPCYEIAEDDGDVRYRWAPLPEAFDPDLGLHRDLDEEIVQLLGHRSIADCVRSTLVPARTIEMIRDCMTSWHRDAMRANSAEPQAIVVSRATLPGNARAQDAAFHVIAADRARGRVWTLAVLDVALGAEDLAACLVEELTELPRPRAVRAIITPRDRATRAVVRKALTMTKSSCPGLVARAIVGRRLRPAWDELLWLTTAARRLNRSLEALARERPLSVEQLEKRALVRQGCRAALQWPLVPRPLVSGRTTPSWAAAAE